MLDYYQLDVKDIGASAGFVSTSSEADGYNSRTLQVRAPKFRKNQDVVRAQKPTFSFRVEHIAATRARTTWGEQEPLLNATDASERLKQEFKELTRLHSEISVLCSDDEYDDDFLRPTDYAVRKANLLLANVNNIRLGIPTGGHVSTDGMGGIRIEWSVSEKNVRLVIAESLSGKSYIYHEAGPMYGIDRDISPESVSEWLDWLFV
jgi:hypothetical protein